jgi:hypothetical protein
MNEYFNPQSGGSIADALNPLLGMLGNLYGMNQGSKIASKSAQALSESEWDRLAQQVAAQLAGQTGQLLNPNDPQFNAGVEERANQLTNEAMEKFNSATQAMENKAARLGNAGGFKSERRDEMTARQLMKAHQASLSDARAERLKEMLEGAKAVAGPGGVQGAVGNVAAADQNRRAAQAGAEMQGDINKAQNVPGLLQNGSSLVQALMKALGGSKEGANNVLSKTAEGAGKAGGLLQSVAGMAGKGGVPAVKALSNAANTPGQGFNAGSVQWGDPNQGNFWTDPNWSSQGLKFQASPEFADQPGLGFDTGRAAVDDGFYGLNAGNTDFGLSNPVGGGMNLGDAGNAAQGLQLGGGGQGLQLGGGQGFQMPDMGLGKGLDFNAGMPDMGVGQGFQVPEFDTGGLDTGGDFQSFDFSNPFGAGSGQMGFDMPSLDWGGGQGFADYQPFDFSNPFGAGGGDMGFNAGNFDMSDWGGDFDWGGMDMGW